MFSDAYHSFPRCEFPILKPFHGCWSRKGNFSEWTPNIVSKYHPRANEQNLTVHKTGSLLFRLIVRNPSSTFCSSDTYITYRYSNDTCTCTILTRFAWQSNRKMRYSPLYRQDTVDLLENITRIGSIVQAWNSGLLANIRALYVPCIAMQQALTFV